MFIDSRYVKHTACRLITAGSNTGISLVVILEAAELEASCHTFSTLVVRYNIRKYMLDIIGKQKSGYTL